MHKSIAIVTPACCRDLTVLETARTEIFGVQDSPVDTTNDERIAVLIKQASSVVSAYCNQMFAQETIRETFWSDLPWRQTEWKESFMLSRGNVSSIVSVTIDDEVLDPSEYRLATDGHVHRIDPIVGGICQWSWTATAEIVYTSGYPLLGELPYGVERATLLLVKDFFFSSGRDPRVRSEDIPGLRNVSYWIGGNTGGNSGTLPPDVLALLAPYKRLVFA